MHMIIMCSCMTSHYIIRKSVPEMFTVNSTDALPRPKNLSDLKAL